MEVPHCFDYCNFILLEINLALSPCRRQPALKLEVIKRRKLTWRHALLPASSPAQDPPAPVHPPGPSGSCFLCIRSGVHSHQLRDGCSGRGRLSSARSRIRTPLFPFFHHRFPPLLVRMAEVMGEWQVTCPGTFPVEDSSPGPCSLP